MAFTASGSIAVFADDFVEENTPSVEPGDLIPVSKEVVWNEDNFGALVELQGDHTVFPGLNTSVKLNKGEKVKTDDLKKVTIINLSGLKGEIKGLEYFTGLTSFDDTGVAEFKNKSLDFSANTALTDIKITKAADLAEITLPEADADENYHLTALDLEGTALTDLDLSKQEKLTDLTVKNSKLGKLDLSALTLNNVTVTGNYNLAEVALNNGRKGNYKKITTLDLSNNSLETVNLDYIEVGTLNLSNNHIGALDLSKTKATTSDLRNQTFYVSEQAKNVNLKEAISGLKATKVDAENYDEETGVLTLNGKTGTYSYNTGLNNAKDTTDDLTVTLTAANPMNRLYNPNSGEHFYTANIKEKEALVALGWKDEGYGWVAPSTDSNDDKKGNPVFRLYNPNAGDHHYTMSDTEVKTLVAYGWKDEGTGWYSASNDADKVTVYRQYNPYANGAGSHNYTTNKAENDYLVSLGWVYEGAAWTALK
nr:hypothetical protein [Allobaculum stercoricanis]